MPRAPARRSKRALRCTSPTRRGSRCRNRATACGDAAACLCHVHGGAPLAAMRRDARQHAAFFDALDTPPRARPRSAAGTPGSHERWFHRDATLADFVGR